MKILLAIGFLAASLSLAAVSLPAHANDADTAAKNDRRADGQVYKAERAAARGDGYGAAKHADNARRDQYKARREEHSAIRKGELY